MSWCLDLYDAPLPAAGERVLIPANPLVTEDGRVLDADGSRFRVTRGGCWTRGIRHSRSGLRPSIQELARTADIGFRLVRSV
jgi:formylglycine-generating enzyme required for sulfatase activity